MILARMEPALLLILVTSIGKSYAVAFVSLHYINHIIVFVRSLLRDPIVCVCFYSN